MVSFAATVRQLEQMQRDRHQRTGAGASSLPGRTAGSERALTTTHPHHPAGHGGALGNALVGAGHGDAYECVALHVSPDLGERLMLSGERALLDEVRHVSKNNSGHVST